MSDLVRIEGKQEAFAVESRDIVMPEDWLFEIDGETGGIYAEAYDFLAREMGVNFRIVDSHEQRNARGILSMVKVKVEASFINQHGKPSTREYEVVYDLDMQHQMMRMNWEGKFSYPYPRTLEEAEKRAGDDAKFLTERSGRNKKTGQDYTAWVFTPNIETDIDGMPVFVLPTWGEAEVYKKSLTMRSNAAAKAYTVACRNVMKAVLAFKGFRLNKDKNGKLALPSIKIWNFRVVDPADMPKALPPDAVPEKGEVIEAEEVTEHVAEPEPKPASAPEANHVVCEVCGCELSSQARRYYDRMLQTNPETKVVCKSCKDGGK